MRQKNEKLKVYEFLYNRLPLAITKLKSMKQCSAWIYWKSILIYILENQYKNMELHWHCEVVVGTEHEMINVLDCNGILLLFVRSARLLRRTLY